MTAQKRALIALIVISFVILLQNVTASLIAYIVASYPDVGQLTVRNVQALPTLIGLFVSFAIGPVALKINKKFLLIFTTSCAFVYFVIISLVGSKGPFWMLLVAAAIIGISQGAGRTLTGSIVAEFFPQEKRASIVAITTAMMSAGAAIMSIVGGNIAAGNGGANWSNAYYLGYIILPAVLIFAILMPKQPDVESVGGASSAAAKAAEPTGGKKERIPPRVFAIMVLNAVFGIALISFSYTVSSYVITEYKLGTSAQAGLASTIYTMMGVFISFSYPLWQKFLKKWTTPVGYAMLTAGLLIMINVTTTLAGLYCGAVLCGVGLSIANPYVSAQIMKYTPRRLVPVALSLTTGLLNLCMYFALYIITFLGGLAGGGVRGNLVIGCILGAISTIAAVFLYGLEKTPKAVTTTEGV